MSTLRNHHKIEALEVSLFCLHNTLLFPLTCANSKFKLAELSDLWAAD